jgi:hypothetical protein
MGVRRTVFTEVIAEDIEREAWPGVGKGMKCEVDGIIGNKLFSIFELDTG